MTGTRTGGEKPHVAQACHMSLLLDAWIHVRYGGFTVNMDYHSAASCMTRLAALQHSVDERVGSASS